MFYQKKKNDQKFKLIPLFILFLLVGMGVLGVGHNAMAATYYVDQNNPSAADSNPGTEQAPWETLTKACSSVVAGDTVLVKAGYYSDPNAVSSGDYRAFNPSNSGTSGNPITFQSLPTGAAIIRPRDYPNNTYISWGLDSKNYIIMGKVRLFEPKMSN